MNTTTNDLSLKLVYVAILAGLVLAFTSPLHVATRPNQGPVAANTPAR
jgi:hypothetical protein